MRSGSSDTGGGFDKGGMDTGKYVRYTPEQVEALERVYSVRRVPQAQLRTQAAVAVRVPHRLEHRAQADQCLVPGASCPTEQALT